MVPGAFNFVSYETVSIPGSATILQCGKYGVHYPRTTVSPDLTTYRALHVQVLEPESGVCKPLVTYLYQRINQLNISGESRPLNSPSLLA